MSDWPTPIRPPQRLEPAHGDVVVLRRAVGDGAAGPATGHRWLVVEWGSHEVVEDYTPDASLDGARGHARIVAAGRRRQAWDGTGRRLLPLPRLPVVSASAAGTFWISTDVTEPSEGPALTIWRSHASLTPEQALAVLAENGFPGELGARMLAAARRPPTDVGA